MAWDDPAVTIILIFLVVVIAAALWALRRRSNAQQLADFSTQQQRVILQPFYQPSQQPSPINNVVVSKYCFDCGTEMPKSSSFCPKCGKSQP